MNKTQIEWVKNPDGSQGYTWNPITGCLNGCEYCYARKLANTRLNERYLANRNVSPVTEGVNDLAYSLRYATPFYPRFWIEKRLSGGSPKGIFVCDMSDLFGIGIPEEWTNQVLGEMRIYKQHRFYLLTKQPQNLVKFSPFPDNCWVGVTATDDDMYCDAIFWLHNIEARVKYISFEPLLAEVSSLNPLDFAGINWVIIGAQTKPTVYPKIEWINEIVSACDKAGVKVFLKDNLKPLLKYPVSDHKWAFTENRGCYFPRQELPK